MAKWHDYKHWSNPKYGRQNRQIEKHHSGGNVRRYGAERGPKVDLGDPKFERKVIVEQKKRRQFKNPINDKPIPSFTGTIGGLVSIIILFGVIATAFIAYDNIDKPWDEKIFFSPSVYLSELGTKEAVLVARTLPVLEKKAEGFGYEILGVTVGYVHYTYAATSINGELFSSNYLGRPFTNDRVYRFTIDGIDFYSRPATDEEQEQYVGLARWSGQMLDIPETAVQVFESPSIDSVVFAWSNIAFISDEEEGKYNLVDCLSLTGDFIVKYLQYQVLLFQKILPWNSNVLITSVPVDIPWIDQNGEYLAPENIE